MEDIGDIIYFIMIVVFAIAGMLGKKGKKQEKQEKPIPQKEEEEVIIPSWEEFEKQLQRKTEVVKPQPEPQPKPVARSRSYESPQKKTYRTEVSPESAETIYSPEYEKPVFETLSYDTVDDVRKLRVKKQMKESVFKKQSSLKTVELEELHDTSRHLDIEFDSVEDVRKAFIYSEIFNRKYQ